MDDRVELEMARKAYQTGIDLAQLQARVERLERLCWWLAGLVLVLAVTGSIAGSLALARAPIWHLSP